MTDDALERVLRLVSEGRLTAAEAAPILDALDGRPAGDAPATDQMADAPASAVRIEVTDHGRTIVNLRMPLALGRTALHRIPGLSEATAERIREAITAGIKGSILDVDDGEGDTVRVVIE
ncbi:MAG TPA: hypothetical protein VLA44_11235 [Clostridia bacterium]|nr:hypothetical protein [Clostridia bacterium]